jgi:hypothetical protein
MLASVDRETALCILRDEEHAAVKDLIEALTDKEMTRPNTVKYGLYPGQAYAFKDLLAHMNAYEVWALDAHNAYLQGEKHTVVDGIWQRGRDLHFASSGERAHLSLEEMIDMYVSTAEALEQLFGGINDDEWAQPVSFNTASPTNLGGLLESIIVAPPRPLYRHLPVHIPDAAGYIAQLRS